MPLTEQQAKTIKQQLLAQIQKLPPTQQQQARSFISNLDNQQLEQFLIQNNMLKPEQIEQSQQNQQGQQSTQQSLAQKPSQNKNQQTKPAGKNKLTKLEKDKQKCIFCALANKRVPSLPIYEDDDFIAVLDINPITKAHTLLIPKKHIRQAKSLPSKSLTTANMIGKAVIKKLKARSFQVNTNAETGHAIINILPVYKNKEFGERKPADNQELQEIAIKIGKITKKSGPKSKSNKATSKAQKNIEQGIDKGIIKLSRRIP